MTDDEVEVEAKAVTHMPSGSSMSIPSGSGGRLPSSSIYRSATVYSPGGYLTTTTTLPPERPVVAPPKAMPKSGRVLIAFVRDDGTTEWAEQVLIDDMNVSYVKGGPAEMTLNVRLVDMSESATPAPAVHGITWSAHPAPRPT